MSSYDTYNHTRKTVSSSNNNHFLFIPCINCNNLVHIENIEVHSNTCTRVKEEVIVAESSQFTYHMIDYKLKKLQEHLNEANNSVEGQYSTNNSNYLSSLDYSKDMHYILSLQQYITDAISMSKIGHKTIIELKKILTNIDTLTVTYKGSMSTLILIERTRVLVNEKIVILKEDFKKTLQTKKINERKSGHIK